MIAVSELESLRDALKRAKYSGLRRVQFQGRLYEYNSVDDMQKAIADLSDEIASTQGTPASTFSLATHSRD
jgi:hypothetical protein